jgi:NADH-quinone oxidoreductase subunit J
MTLQFVFSLLFIVFFIFSLIHESIFFSIFFLICLFLISSFLFILLGFEFIGFLYLIVYVGAIAVLFLFMVMLFDKSEYLFFSNDVKGFSDDKSDLLSMSLGIALVWFVLLYSSFISVENVLVSNIYSNKTFIENFLVLDLPFNTGSNLQRIGSVLYDYFSLTVIGAGVVLLVGMVGAITLTQTFFFGEKFKRHQEIKDQIVRKKLM